MQSLSWQQQRVKLPDYVHTWIHLTHKFVALGYVITYVHCTYVRTSSTVWLTLYPSMIPLGVLGTVHEKRILITLSFAAIILIGGLDSAMKWGNHTMCVHSYYYTLHMYNIIYIQSVRLNTCTSCSATTPHKSLNLWIDRVWYMYYVSYVFVVLWMWWMVEEG